MTVAKKLSKCKLDLVGVHEVGWDKSGTAPAGEYTFFYRKVNGNHELSAGSFVHKIIISAVKRIEFVSDSKATTRKTKDRWVDNSKMDFRETE
jgi:hypothetical protein